MTFSMSRGRGFLAESGIMEAVILTAFAASYEPLRSSPPTLPQRLESLARVAKLTADERKRLSDGAPIAKLLDLQSTTATLEARSASKE